VQAANGLQKSAPLLSEVEVNESEYTTNEQESREGSSPVDSHEGFSHKDSHEDFALQDSHEGFSHQESQASHDISSDKELQASRVLDEQVGCCKFLRRACFISFIVPMFEFSDMHVG